MSLNVLGHCYPLSQIQNSTALFCDHNVTNIVQLIRCEIIRVVYFVVFVVVSVNAANQHNMSFQTLTFL